MLIGSRSGRSRSEPPLATFCSAGVLAGSGHRRPATMGVGAGYGPRLWTTGTPSCAASSTSGPSTSSRPAAAPMARTTEIWTTVVDGQTYICGTPNASQPGVEHQPRDWLANLVATPSSWSGSRPRCTSTCRPRQYGSTTRPSAGTCSPLPTPSTTATQCRWRPPSPTVQWCGCSSPAMPPGWLPRFAPGGGGLNHLGESRRSRALRLRLDSDLADVPTMYHANGKQRGTAGNSGHLTTAR